MFHPAPIKTFQAEDRTLYGCSNLGATVPPCFGATEARRYRTIYGSSILTDIELLNPPLVHWLHIGYSVLSRCPTLRATVASCTVPTP